MSNPRKKLLAGVLASAVLSLNSAFAGAIVAGFNGTVFGANDDGSVGPIGMGFTANFFGANYSSLFVNNNGNVTFGSALGTFTPSAINSATSIAIIAPFFGDVDTRVGNEAAYGTGFVGTHLAFGVTWDSGGVGYFSQHTEKKNEFQVLLVDRSDVAAGAFDIYFNYDQIQWETGDLSGGVGGLGGTSAVVGYSAGTGVAGTFAQLPGSLVPGSFLDTGPAATSLIHNSNVGINGRFVFEVRNGVVVNPPGSGVPDGGSAMILLGLALAGLAVMKRKIR